MSELPDFKKFSLYLCEAEYVFRTFILQQLFSDYPKELIKVIMHKMYFHIEFRVFISEDYFIAGYNDLFIFYNYNYKIPFGKIYLPTSNNQINTIYSGKNMFFVITKKDKYYICNMPRAHYSEYLEIFDSKKMSQTMNAKIVCFCDSIKTIKIAYDSIIMLKNNGTIDTSTSKIIINKPSFTNIIHVDCGLKHMLLMKSDYSLYVAGSNEFGQLGLGHNYDIKFFIENKMANLLSASCGYNHTIVLTKSGELYSSGCNDVGQLGLGDYMSRNTMTKLNVENVLDIKVAYYHALAICRNNDIYMWGYNNYGQLCLEDTKSRSNPTKLSISNTIKSIHCDIYYTIILTTDNKYKVYSRSGDFISNKLNELQ